VSAFSVLVADLETAVQQGHHDKRVAILRQVTDLFVGGAEAFSEEHVDLFGDVLARLIDQVENRVLAELSIKLAPVANAPGAVIQTLARHDEIAVAGPVLTQSVRLSDGDLLDIAKSKGQMHLGAISERARLAAAVTDVLVERGNATVVRKLSRNHGATFSDAGFSALAKRAECDAQLAEGLGGRVDLPPSVLRDLMAKATDAVRARLIAYASPAAHAEIQRALGVASARVAREVAAPRDFRRAESVIDGLHVTDQLDEAAVVQFAEAGRYEEMVVALARLCDAPIELIESLLQSISPDGLLLACRACDIHWQTFSAVVTKRVPHRPMSAVELEKARVDFLKLTPAMAKRIYRFWMVRDVAKKH
jgi:uncharacterized protein (DUF2336 family)